MEELGNDILGNKSNHFIVMLSPARTDDLDGNRHSMKLGLIETQGRGPSIGDEP